MITTDRTMADAVDPTKLPAGLQAYAGYFNGAKSAWTPAQLSNDVYPGASLVRIDVIGSAAAQCGVLDVETGDATPDHVPAWVDTRHHLGLDATVYCNLSTWPAVKAAVGSRAVRYWIADPSPGVAHAIPGASAVQWLWAAGFDLSVITDPTWHPAPDPVWLTQARAALVSLTKALAVAP